MKCKTLLIMMIFSCLTISLWSDHFLPVYQGNGYNNMTFFIESAMINGSNMEAGDEIGIFDGNLCVGSGTLTNQIPPVLQLTASADDPLTGEIDGFLEGNPIIFKLWDLANNCEIIDVDASYLMGDGNFMQLGTASVNLAGSIHFLPVYQGNGYNNMIFFIESATINSISLELKDEIGIFDGDLCVGAGILTSEIPPVFQIVCSADDPLTSEIDGFIDGNSIIYKFWDFSDNTERLDIVPNYSMGDGTFAQLGTSMVDLAWVNSPPIAYAGADQIVEEGEIVQLDGSGSYDPDLQPLTYLWTAPVGVILSDPTAVDPTFTAPDVPTNIPVDYEFILIVDDGFSIELRENSEPDTVIITIENINQAPEITLPDEFAFDEDGSLIEDFTPYISDPDEDQLTLSVSGNTNITVSISDFEVTFSALPDWNGVETLTFTVDDNQNRATASDNIDVNVIPVNDPPVLNGYIPEELAFTVIQDSIVTFSVDAEDIDSILDYEWYVNGVLQIETSESFIHQFSDVGFINIISLISDGEYDIEILWEITVEPVSNAGNILVYQTRLNNCYPNPFNPTTTIIFATTNSHELTQIEIYNLKGQKVNTLVNDKLSAGQHSVVWNGTDDAGKQATSGVYFYKMKAGNFSSTKKMLLLR